MDVSVLGESTLPEDKVKCGPLEKCAVVSKSRDGSVTTGFALSCHVPLIDCNSVMLGDGAYESKRVLLTASCTGDSTCFSFTSTTTTVPFYFIV